MSNFMVKYIVVILTLATMGMFTDRIMMGFFMVLSVCIVGLAIVEAMTGEKKNRKRRKNERTHKKVEVVVFLLPTNRY